MSLNRKTGSVCNKRLGLVEEEGGALLTGLGGWTRGRVELGLRVGVGVRLRVCMVSGMSRFQGRVLGNE
ncbi:hypothetical protein ANANG_G00164740 [Anguilla anguilla]|uniref:Uncharacterized protein n=1 Tax=Anguilla anguilla TaxID=7936 RepID=A0A9D3RVJ1_ANGAN|nr:hypothetical protein ANANG_G00164740 [Anguilla anguilla]